MIARLIEANYVENAAVPSQQQVRFWLREMRTPRYLVEIARRYPDIAGEVASERPLLQVASKGDAAELEERLLAEERAERHEDENYWRPLRRELEQLRRVPKTD